MKTQAVRAGRSVSRRSGGTRSRRQDVVAALDRMLEKSKNLKALEAALEAKFLEDPVRFFRKFVMPLLPRETLVSPVTPNDGIVEWKSLVEAFPLPRKTATTPGKE